jgi:hypothetical protein
MFCIISTAKRLFQANAEKSSGDSVGPLIGLVLVRSGLNATESELKYYQIMASVLMTGAIIVSTVRTLIDQLARLSRLFRKDFGGDLLLLIISQVMGTYVMGSLMLLCSSGPGIRIKLLTEILGSLRVDPYARLFDVVFLYSAMLGTVPLYFLAPPVN